LKLRVKKGETRWVNSILAESTETHQQTLELSSRMDEFEGYASAHGRRIAAIADALAAEFNLASRDRFFLQQAAMLHDIGEVSMNREYIRSNRVLTINERLDLQRHPVIGEQEVARIGLPRGVQLIVRWHHEWWNGSGYPDALESEQIPLAARILRAADTYAALTASRPFRGASSADEAKRYLVEWAGIEFDPAVVRAFLKAARDAASKTSKQAAG
jgi:HD-GYP domain-containing protein (c-di-GMP phosphodiesterase class II)